MLESTWRKGNLRALLGGMKTENSMEGPQKIKHGTALQASGSASECIPKKPKTNSKEYMHPYVQCSAIYKSQEWKQTKWPSKDKWLKKLRYIYMVFPEGIQPYNIKNRDIY